MKLCRELFQLLQYQKIAAFYLIMFKPTYQVSRRSVERQVETAVVDSISKYLEVKSNLPNLRKCQLGLEKELFSAYTSAQVDFNFVQYLQDSLYFSPAIS